MGWEKILNSMFYFYVHSSWKAPQQVMQKFEGKLYFSYIFLFIKKGLVN